MSALSKIKAVYCITDTSTGKLYVGSANSKNDGYTKENAEKDAGSSKGLWGRWQYYAGEKSKGNKAEKDEEKNLTGDDKFFEDLIKTTDGKEYIKNYFTYTILEIFDIRTADIVVRERERFWKKALHTLYPYGMNYNL